MVSSPPRGPITTRVITELKVENFPVGDNAAPEDPFGWQGQPNDDGSTFIPWMSVTPTSAVPQTVMSFGDTGREWRMSYNVFYAGISRKQSEALADRMRARLTNIAREGVNGWKIQKISCNAIGSNNRVGSAYPDYYTQTDNFEVWVSKESS